MATVELTTSNFDSTIEENDIVLLDFWAEWCGPCRNFAPVYEAVSQKHPDIVFGKVDTDSQKPIAAAFQIQSIPTVMAFREQIPVFAQPGVLPGPMLEQLIEKIRELDMADVREQYEEMKAKHETEQQS